MTTRAVGAVAVLLLLTAVLPAEGQLISPGKLAAPHSSLEGIRNCTQCHQLGRRGVSRDLCLDCHEPLAARLAQDEGFHTTLAEPNCASCHKDHFGADFALIKLDTLDFDHGRTGYLLEGAHGETSCRACHEPIRVVDPVVRRIKTEHGALDRTFLGLGTGCTDCHADDDPHDGTFTTQPCTDCHSQERWDGAAGFDHGSTRYPLTGRHRAVECRGCHTDLPAGVGPGESPAGAVLRFDGLVAGGCARCHTDPHEGTMNDSCESCHDTGDWLGVDRERVASRFDHTTTGFDLLGRHRTLDCGDCHDARRVAEFPTIAMQFDETTTSHAFPRPLADAACATCHVDPHEGVFADRPSGGACTDCHGDMGWLPAEYDLARHNLESDFTLQGAHTVVPCATCHESADGRVTFAIGVPEGCATCHAEDDPHGDQFTDRGCDDCHGIEAFTPVALDHAETRYPLEGAHAELACTDCHRSEPDGRGGWMTRFRPLGTECRDCHGGTP